jgi:hypothetical protein
MSKIPFCDLYAQKGAKWLQHSRRTSHAGFARSRRQFTCAVPRREFSHVTSGLTLAAIARLDPALNAIVQKDAASAWRAASDSDARIARGDASPRRLAGEDQRLFRGADTVTSAGALALKPYPTRRCERGGPAAPRRSDPARPHAPRDHPARSKACSACAINRDQ